MQAQALANLSDHCKIGNQPGRLRQRWIEALHVAFTGGISALPLGECAHRQHHIRQPGSWRQEKVLHHQEVGRLGQIGIIAGWIGRHHIQCPGRFQRGFQIYNEVCKNCHSLKRVSFASLTDPDGPDFSKAEAKAIAKSYQIPAKPNKQGQIVDSSGNRLTRPGTLADDFPSPFANIEAAKAMFNGAAPPDLSVIVEARDGGPQYVYSILTGFGQTPPKGFKPMSGKFYNPYFPGWNISMPPPLADSTAARCTGTTARTSSSRCSAFAGVPSAKFAKNANA